MTVFDLVGEALNLYEAMKASSSVFPGTCRSYLRCRYEPPGARECVSSSTDSTEVTTYTSNHDAIPDTD
ncbi:hypothetical protein CY34DRAFT_538302 [Suillus luteus UH-Slu-Lm8-n1]|uniref:Uncharacterized protein n=1 Tax=Suillus luteus UH-Slu-Lm8-n1 TaxID=930992 RepID=A0A0C9ZFA1_9AGAM|nr:hypothetical protein CY34DRAFT_538302 [Suillus luteus UH-Slu-Lm8-n1]